MKSNRGNIIPLFAIPAIITNIGRDFTEEELQFFLTDLPMWKDEQGGMVNHRSKDLYLFDNFVEELKDILTSAKENVIIVSLKQFLTNNGSKENSSTIRKAKII